ncbi:hypothetical protein K0M31_013900 [Melipona bicolor]|uniref:Uncharacterized protein n=1 Tax=Melipona bicolor TaxID=60889 RepID=A0AA40G7G8_9HYME|nr:hypothetical protein K0M31_013900 [Melipona bicolor]
MKGLTGSSPEILDKIPGSREGNLSNGCSRSPSSSRSSSQVRHLRTLWKLGLVKSNGQTWTRPR